MEASPSAIARRWSVWTGAAGILSALCWGLGHILWWRQPDASERGAIPKLVKYYADDGNVNLAATMFVAYLVAAFLFGWFLVGLLRTVRTAERAQGRAGSLSVAVLVGGIILLVFSLLGGMGNSLFGISVNFDHAFVVTPGTVLFAMLVADLAYGMVIASMAGAALMLFAVWAIARRTDALPTWLAWIAFVIAILTLGGPFTSWGTPLLVAAWVLVTGVVMIVRRPSENAAAAPPEEAATASGPDGP